MRLLPVHFGLVETQLAPLQVQSFNGQAHWQRRPSLGMMKGV